MWQSGSGATVALLIVTFAGISSVTAQPHCTAGDTPRECVIRWIPRPPEKGTAAPATPAPAAEAVKTTVASYSGGLSSIDAPVRTALKDLLSALSGTLDSAVFGENGTSLTFGYNLPGTIIGGRRQLRLEATFDQPQLSAGTTAVTDPVAKAELERSLSSLDDFKVGLTFSPNTWRFGRSLDPHLELFSAVYLAGLRSSGADPEMLVAQAAAAAGIAAADLDKRISELAADVNAQRSLLTALETSSATAFPAAPTGVTNDFAVLLGNQPQLYASGLFHRRKEVVGPNEWTAKLTWEIGSRNLNSFYGSEGRDCRTISLEDARCAAAFALFLQRFAGARRAHRLALSIEYRASSEVDVFPAGALVPYTLEPAHSVVYSGVYGRPFVSLISGKEGWIDFSFDYNGQTHTSNVSTTSGSLARRATPLAVEGTLRLPPSQLRSAASMTYVQKINDRFSFPVSFVYEDFIEYVPSLPVIVSPVVPLSVVARPQQRMTVRVGLTYRIPSGSFPDGGRCASCCCA